jgi:hypothetical protein
MSIEYDVDDTSLTRGRIFEKRPTGITGFFIKKGWAATKREATGIFLIVIIVSLIGTFLIDSKREDPRDLTNIKIDNLLSQ